MRNWVIALCACVPLRAGATPWGIEADTYLGASSTNAIYGSRGSADLGLTALGRYALVVGGAEYQYSDSNGDTGQYVGGLAGVAVPFGERYRLYALGNGGFHRVDKGFTYGTDLRGTTVSGETEYGSAYAGGQLRFQIGFGERRRIAMNFIAHARFDVDRDEATVTEADCTVVFCSTPMTKTYDVGGRAIGGALGLAYAF